MHRLKLVIGVCVFGISTSGCAESEPPPAITEEIAWGYEEANGPDIWGQLNPDYILCAEGTMQSPIDLVAPTESALNDIMFSYQPSQMSVHHNGHTIEVAPAEENWIEIDGERYDLLQFHFHAPSEHTVAGELFDMEMHLVHRNEAGTLAVVGVMITQRETATRRTIPCGRSCRPRQVKRTRLSTPLSMPGTCCRATGRPIAMTDR